MYIVFYFLTVFLCFVTVGYDDILNVCNSHAVVWLAHFAENPSVG